MKYQIDKQERYSIFSLEEANLNSIIAPQLKSEFVFFRNEGVRNLIFDLKDVDYIDSSGLSSILTANRIWKDYGAFVLVNMNSESVKKLIEISKLDSILTIIPTIEEAVEYVHMEDLERELNEEEE
ncbi:MAG: STAS domain-containing protein [Saprospiraceae bacterium]|jgi:anti-sigma B factor antagonist|uniref:STAS domain-containing protein n=1 Tax=Candidatus Defluviibacterium haderslevense TaxID=2981993 RepID=A0A9D7SCL4_9BACT|nr:STAS domain-containing protein [Candidatus Defluviibacterium haderslevense]MCC7025597.1 STAS domain-containing protein [Saprospiraceae bacterium]MBK7245837.1 STAS domain-containing protein [Candidatus Defluviibacterium haderslevense]MBK8244113.1 STAS domain-containing protein [Candidatus Defluviibacterium haderslevense]MBK9718729.1 STAS domain-containing protein [Candidatus Defluviibacterium haderslevense]